ncbi:hypothetical protein ACE103_29905 [Bradyrhizobium sp. ma5]
MSTIGSVDTKRCQQWDGSKTMKLSRPGTCKLAARRFVSSPRSPKALAAWLENLGSLRLCGLGFGWTRPFSRASMTPTEAKIEILKEWDRWIGTQPGLANPTGRDAFKFFLDLRSSNSALLDFGSVEDKWQVIHGWLLSAGRVTD